MHNVIFGTGDYETMTHRKKWMTKYKSIAFHLIVALNFPHDIYFFYLQFLLFSIIKYIFVRCTRVSEHRMWFLCRNDERIFGSPQQFIKKKYMKNLWRKKYFPHKMQK